MVRSIRPKAICIIRNGPRILLEYSKLPTVKDVFYIPLGGQIRFGEYGKDAIRREILEEIREEVKNIRYLGTIENIFDTENDVGHEIVLVFEADFVNPLMYDKELIEGMEREITPPLRIEAYWKTLGEVEAEGVPLYPEGLRELLLGI